MKLFQFQLCPIIWYITIFLVIFWSFPNCISSDLQWYNTCGSYFNCGNLTHVGFPFWGGNNTRLDNCGYPDLELTCEDGTTIIRIQGMRYHVLEINQSSRMLTLAREDYLKGICMQKFINTTLDFQHFDYGPVSQNITVLYGCPPPYNDSSNVPGQFICKISGTTQTVAYPVDGTIDPSGCYASVVVPVLRTSYVQLGTLSLSQVIGFGFEAKYKLEDEDLVTKCGESGGRFGLDVSKNGTNCLCPDGSVGILASGNTTCSTSF